MVLWKEKKKKEKEAKVLGPIENLTIDERCDGRMRNRGLLLCTSSDPKKELGHQDEQYIFNWITLVQQLQ